MDRTVIPAQGWVVAKNFAQHVEEYAVIAFVVCLDSNGNVKTGAIIARSGKADRVWPDGVEYQLMREASDDE